MRAIPTTAAALAALLSAGCGTMETPDLATGTVTGRISTASPGAYAYVLGYPDVHAAIAADGSFRIDRVPAGQRRIVLFDGSDGAGTVDVQVEGGSISDAAPAGSLPPACAILAAAMLAGAQPTGLAFSVDGALLRAGDGTPTREVSGPAAVLFPLPAGTWTLRASQPGFAEKAQAAYVAGGQSWPIDLSLDVESASEHRGCISSGCESPLACDAGDGRCYQCTSAADCAGAPCTDHVCVTPPPAGGLGMCQACQQPGDCKPGPGGAATQPPACVVPAGAAVGYCSYDCGPSPAECPAGYRYDNVPAGMMTGNPAKACLAKDSCLALYTTFGANCATDGACSTALDGGKCWRPNGASDYTAGTCSAPCSAYAYCPPWLADWTCDATQYCRPP